VAATAAFANLTIICPEYRLAPAHPFPAGLNDALSVYKTLIKRDGYNPENIVLLGDSAGGGLVAAMAIQLQREGEPLPAALGMMSPWSDPSGSGDTRVTMNAIDPLITGADALTPEQARDPAKNSLDGVVAGYTGGNASLLSDPLVSPVLADYAELFPDRALPPTLIQVGLREVSLSDAVRLYHRMREAAPAPGHVVISPYEAMWHVFQAYVNVPESAEASREMAAYFTRALNGQICK
jgi:acetyl esterase/lipase